MSFVARMTQSHWPRRLLRLADKSMRTVRRYGWRDFSARAARKLFPARVHRRAWSRTYGSEALLSAERLDFTPEDLARSRALTDSHRGPIDVRSIAWFLPQFGHAYYGGVHTILRFAASFTRLHGARHTFVLLGDGTPAEAREYAARIGAAFPELAEAPVMFAASDDDLGLAPSADVAVATAWDTAYAVLKFNRTRRKCYFLQDFEPMFFPAGSTSAQAEATYRFGFYGLTNTITLKRHYQDDYQGRATHFDPCVDTGLFYPAAEAAEQPGRPYTVFFYARPDYRRNGFELGAVALRKLKQQFGDRVRIVSAGQRWRPADYGLAGVVENLGLLAYHETARLYRSCDAGLVMMFTRHPSYLPFEFMASGCLVVSNVNTATSWLLRDGENCLLALPSASCIAAALARGLEDVALRRRITAHAARMVREQFADWDRQAEHVYGYMCDPERDEH